MKNTRKIINYKTILMMLLLFIALGLFFCCPNSLDSAFAIVTTEYNINYVLFEGTNDVDNPSTYTPETEMITLQDPIKEYASFLGWYDADGIGGNWGNRIETIAAGSSGNKTLYAKWDNLAVLDFDFDIHNSIENVVFQTNQITKLDSEDITAGHWSNTVFANINNASKTLTIYTPLDKLYLKESANYLFEDCSWITDIDLSKVDTSFTTSMVGMFSGCKNLKNINLESFNTANVEDFTEIFRNCSSLTELDVTGFNTSNCKDFEGMFYGCSSLKFVDVTNFNTSIAENLSDLFEDCSSLISIDVTGFNTSNCMSFGDMFEECSSLKSIDVSNFNTENATTMFGMFEDCVLLKSIDVTNFDTSNCRNISDMFENCSSLTTIDVTNFDTSSAEDLSDLFKGCSSLKSVDVTNFDTSLTYKFSEMFEDCLSLTSLDLSSFKILFPIDDFGNALYDNFSRLKTLDTSDMLKNCSGLTYIKTPNINESVISLPANAIWKTFDIENKKWESVHELNNNSDQHIELFKAQTGSIYDINFYESQVWDAQRSPAFPIADRTIKISGLKNAYNENMQTITWNDGDYVKFEKTHSSVFDIEDETIRDRIITSLMSYTDCTRDDIGNAVVVKEVQYDAGGVVKQVLAEYGLVWALGNEGFLFTAMDGSFKNSGGVGTYISFNAHKSGDTIIYKIASQKPHTEIEVEEKVDIKEIDKNEIPATNTVYFGGTVVDGSGNVLDGVEVRLIYNGISIYLTTDANGNFLSNKIDREEGIDTYQVILQKGSFANATYKKSLNDIGFSNDKNSVVNENQVYIYSNPITDTDVEQTVEEFAITIAVNNSAYGSINKTSVLGVPKGSIITVENNKLYINGTEIVASPTLSNVEYTYAFSGYSTFDSVVNSNITITANFVRTTSVVNNDDNKGIDLLWLYILLSILTGIILILFIVLLCKSKEKNSVEINKNLNKNMISEHITKKYEERVTINKRAKFNLAGFPSPDTYFAGVGKNKKCFAYYYELGEGKQHVIMKISNELFANLAKKHDITASNFPKPDCGWHKLIIDEKFKNKNDLMKVLDEVIKENLVNQTQKK